MDAAERMAQIKEQEWIGVDFDGTLAYHDRWVKWNHFGWPIPKMMERVKGWIAEGKDVRIFTARVGTKEDLERCIVSGEWFTREMMIKALQDWCLEHVGEILPLTATKDKFMVELWDDRAVQVIPNTGQTLADEIDAMRTVAAGQGPV
jgi:hypothetical protein